VHKLTLCGHKSILYEVREKIEEITPSNPADLCLIAADCIQ
jgi:hypothetical protein